MHDINRIRDLQTQQISLDAQYEELDALVDSLKTIRSNQEFLPEAITTSIRTKLADIQTKQKNFLTGYEALNLGSTPSTISGCKVELDDYEKYILEKSSYVEVINFVLSLDSDNASAKAALKQHKAFAASYDCRTNSVAQCETDLRKYILLRDAYEERDPARRLSSIIELSPMIDFPLVVALNTNALTCSGKDSAAEAPAAAVSTAASAPPSGTSASPVSAAATDSAPIAESASAADPSASSVQTSAEPAPVVPESRSAAGAPNPSEDILLENEYWQPRTKYPMPDFTVPQKPISNRPAPDEAPVSHLGIENGLTAELTQVLSRERAAAALSPDVDSTTSHSGDHSDQNSETTALWKELGISRPEDVCYSVPDQSMQIYRREIPKKFSADDFQKEMSLKSPNRFEKQCAIKDAYKYGATSPGLLAGLIREEIPNVKNACDALVNSGYMKAFELSGPAFEQFDRLYVLTAIGRKVFTNSETASVLNLPPAAKPATPPFATHADAVLNRQLFLKSKNLMELYMPSRQFNVGSFILETNSFINFFPTTNNTGTYAYVSVLGNDPRNYMIFQVELEEMLPSLDTITVVGMDLIHAKALADWIYQCFSNKLTGKKFQYYTNATDTYYSYSDGSSFKI
ncbi:MAG: hypothetical protein Q4B03_01910 [Lachnospiraceae bacterium]|nr:hypothetical protein [Lachnospiraceae bacterium]